MCRVDNQERIVAGRTFTDEHRPPLAAEGSDYAIERGRRAVVARWVAGKYATSMTWMLDAAMMTRWYLAGRSSIERPLGGRIRKGGARAISRSSSSRLAVEWATRPTYTAPEVRISLACRSCPREHSGEKHCLQADSWRRVTTTPTPTRQRRVRPRPRGMQRPLERRLRTSGVQGCRRGTALVPEARVSGRAPNRGATGG